MPLAELGDDLGEIETVLHQPPDPDPEEDDDEEAGSEDQDNLKDRHVYSILPLAPPRWACWEGSIRSRA